MSDTLTLFTTSMSLEEHPVKKAKSATKIRYYSVLKHFITPYKDDDNSEYFEMRLKQYYDFLVENSDLSEIENIETNKLIRSVISRSPWKNRYQYFLLCDAALITQDDSNVRMIADSMKLYMGKKQQTNTDTLVSALVGNDTNVRINPISFVTSLVDQYRCNREFQQIPEVNYIVTATMSAGKSTLINALIGKRIARASQEVCTGNLCYIYNKPFEDRHIHLYTDSVNFDADSSDLTTFEWTDSAYISSFFRRFQTNNRKICITDTPGVNSALNKNHVKISRKAIREQSYDKLIYVFNANKLGTDEEIKHLKWVLKYADKDKIIFVLNKLDSFNRTDDNISQSIEGVKKDLIKLGIENPTVLPLSVYFGLLIKMKQNGDPMTEDEEDEYKLLSKKFREPDYDLSGFYEGIYADENDSEEIFLSKKCGLYGLEKILFGGIK